MRGVTEAKPLFEEIQPFLSEEKAKERVLGLSRADFEKIAGGQALTFSKEQFVNDQLNAKYRSLASGLKAEFYAKKDKDEKAARERARVVAAAAREAERDAAIVAKRVLKFGKAPEQNGRCNRNQAAIKTITALTIIPSLVKPKGMKNLSKNHWNQRVIDSTKTILYFCRWYII